MNLLRDTRDAPWPIKSAVSGSAIRERAKRRTRCLIIGSIAAAVLVAGGLTAAVALVGRAGDGAGLDVAVARGAHHQDLEVDQPSSGFRMMGAIGLIVEVPIDWGANLVGCDGSARADTVAYILDGVRSCSLQRDSNVSSLYVMSESVDIANELASVDLRARKFDSVEVLVSQLTREEGMWSFTLRDEPAGVVVVMRTDAKAEAVHALESLRPIPDGLAVVPRAVLPTVAESLAAVVARGLTPVVRGSTTQDSARVVKQQPEQGAVLPQGAPVELILRTQQTGNE